MAKLPIFNTDDRVVSMLQTRWSALISPFLESKVIQGQQLNDITLVSGDNTINHKLSRKLQGYMVVLKSAASDIYDKQATNTMTDKTLVLNASSPCVISLWVY